MILSRFRSASRDRKERPDALAASRAHAILQAARSEANVILECAHAVKAKADAEAAQAFETMKIVIAREEAVERREAECARREAALGIAPSG